MPKEPINYAISNDMRFNVVPHIFWHKFNECIWEFETFLFYGKYVSPDKDIVDIGAWHGPTMLLAYSHNPQKIYAVEADPANYQILKANMYKNYLQDKVKLFNVCISGEDDKIVSFGLHDENIQSSTTKGIGNSGVKVKTTTVETFLKNVNMPDVNIIKIDIEGGEQYIENGFEYISQHPGINILLSVHPHFFNDKKTTAEMLLKVFKRFDVFSDTEENISDEEIREKILAETPSRYKDRTGKGFTLILKTKML